MSCENEIHPCPNEETTDSTPVIGYYGGYRKMISYGLTCLIYYATELFCRRNLDRANDPLGKSYGQMLGAARSAKQNIVEGSFRAGTSRETELRLYDVAKGSLAELAGDYEDYLISHGELPWSDDDQQALKIRKMDFALFDATTNIRHKYAIHINQMRQRFAPLLESEDPSVAANALLVTIDRASALLHRQMEKIGEDFRKSGGFTEHLTRVRLEGREAGVNGNDDVPNCPDCGKPMRKVIAKRGINAGKPFWSCVAYPSCRGTRNCY